MMSEGGSFVMVWDVAGGFISSDDEEIVGAIGLDEKGYLLVVASETEEADAALEQVCERVNSLRVIHVRKAASDGSVFTSQAYIFSREDPDFAEAVAHHLTYKEFLKLSVFNTEVAV